MPLHVGGSVGASAGERVDMVDDVTGTGAAGFSGGGAGMLVLERVLGGFTAGSVVAARRVRGIRAGAICGRVTGPDAS